MKLLRRAAKILLFLVLGLTLLSVLAIVAVRLAPVQNWLLGKTTTFLSEKLQTKVSAGGVYLEFFKTARLDRLYVEDRRGDTLIFAEKLRADIGIFNLFKNEIHLNSASLEGAVVNLRRPATDSIFNYRFVVDAFAGDTAPDTAAASPWQFGIGELTLQDVRFAMLDEGEGRFDLQTKISKWQVAVNELDLPGQTVALDRVALEDSQVIFRQLQRTDPPAATPAEPAKLEFPGFGWTISAEKIRLDRNRIAYLDDNAPRLENALDYSHLDLREMVLSIDDFQYADDGILAEINGAAFRDAGGFVLEKLAGEVAVLPEKIEVKKLILKTPGSQIKNDTRLVFSEFNDLTDFLTRVKLESEFQKSHLALSDLLMVAPALGQIGNLHLPQGETIRLEGSLTVADEKISASNLAVSIGETQLRASGSVAQITTDPLYDLQLTRLSTSYASLNRYTRNLGLPPGLKNFGQFTLAGKVQGTLADLEATSLQLTTETATRFAGDLQARGLPDVDNTVFNLKIKQLATRSEDLQGFAESPLPPQLDSLGLVQFAGNFNGTIRDFQIDGDFRTSAGNAGADLSIDFNQDFSFARYDGKLAMEKFDLGKILGDTTDIGKVTLSLDLTGEGLRFDDLNTKLTGVVSEAGFRNYDYRNLKVDGHFVQRQFEGKLNMEDKNLDFDLLGKVDLNDSLPDVDVTVNVDTVNFKNLNLMQSKLALSGNLTANLSGNNLDNLDGKATLSNLALSGEQENYFDRQIVLEARQLTGGMRALLLRSGFMTGRVEGAYNFGDLPALVIGFVNDFFPIEEMVTQPDSTLSPRPEVADQRFEFDFQFTGLAQVAGIFLPGFQEMDTSAYLRGSFDSEKKQLTLTGAFPNLDYQGIVADSLLLSASGNRKRLKAALNLRNLNLNNAFFASNFDFNTRLGNDSLHFGLTVLDDTSGVQLQLGGLALEAPENYLLAFDRQLTVAGTEWEVNEKNAVRFTSNDLRVNDLTIQKNRQSFSVTSAGEAPPGELAPLELAFSNFELREISAILNNPNLRLEGGLDGKITVREPRQNLHFNAAVEVNGLSLNDQLLGQLTLDASQPAGRQVIDISTQLSGENEMTVRGSYSVPSNRFDVRGDLEKLSFVVADPFLTTIIRESEGYVSGEFTATGQPDSLALNGSISTHDLSTIIVPAGSRYRFGEGTLTFSEKKIGLGSLALFDPEGRKATLSGEIRHSYFTDIQLDMQAKTDGLQVLNTTREDNRLYYGKLFASADVTIRGTAELPVLTIVAATLDNTLLHVEPLATELAVVQEDYVIFAHPAEYEQDTLKIETSYAGFDLTLQLEVTPQARLNIIIDPATGDELFCSGSGNFTVKMSPAGDLDITGTYIIDEGKYSFNYEGLVKREFEIRKGSSLTLTGDPYDARFDITAVYKTRATTYELISNQANLDDATLSASQRRSDVEVLMNIDGNLNEPEITFDIALPGTQGGGVDNLVARRLAGLREEPTELNKQVFGLLFFNSFIQAETGAGLAGAGENAALKSVSSLITGQLNRLADRYVKGVDLTLGFESYRAAGQDAGTVAEVEVGLSKQLFNDRLTIKVGGNFNIESSQQSSLQEGGYSAFAGDFVLEYKLNDKGNYLLKVFHKSDYNILLDANTNKSGVGIMYRKSY